MRISILSLIFSALILSGALSAQGFSPSIPNGDSKSPTALVTQNFFTEAADQYLNVFRFGDLRDLVFFFQLDPATVSTNDNNPSTVPMKVGLGSWWTKDLYGAGHYEFSSSITGANSINQTLNEVKSFDAATNVYLGRTVTKAGTVNFTETYKNSPAAFLGLRLGNMLLGIRSLTDISGSYKTSTFDTSYSTTTSSENFVRNAADQITSSSGTVYDPAGKYGAGYIAQQILVGLSLPLGSGNLKTSGGLLLKKADTTRLGAVETYTGGQSGFGSFSGFGAAGTIEGVSAYTYSKARYESDNLELALPLTGALEIPFNLFEAKSLFSGGLEYAPTLRFWGSNINNETGAETAVSEGTYLRTYTRTITQDAITGFFTTTAKDINAANVMTTYNLDMENAIRLPVSVEVQPSTAVRFALGLTPRLTLTNKDSTNQTKSVETTVVDDGDGIAASLDPEDSTTVVSKVSPIQQLKIGSTKIDLDFSAGVQVELVKDLLRLNLGTSVTSNILNRTTTDYVYTGLDTTVTQTTTMGNTVTGSVVAANPMNPDASYTIQDTAAASNVQSFIGLTLFLNPNVTFDFKMNTTKALNLTATSGGIAGGGGFFDLTNYKILMTVKLPSQGTGPAVPEGTN